MRKIRTGDNVLVTNGRNKGQTGTVRINVIAEDRVVIEAAKMGAHVATMPPSVLRQLFNHPLTEKGLAQFVADWAKTGQTILDKVAK